MSVLGSILFKPVARPEPVVPDTTLDDELSKAVDNAKLKLYFINLTVASATDLINTDIAIVDKSDPYCEVNVGNVTQKTKTIQNDLNPVWNEHMSFFVPEKPEKITFQLWDENERQKDDSLGEAEYEFGGTLGLFEIGGTFEGDLKLEKVKKGSLRIKMTCRTMKPFETEIKLGYVEKQLEGKEKERTATIAALDESEKLREGAINELTAKEQEIIRQSEEIAEKQKLHQNELTEKEKKILDQSQAIEDKIQQYEEAQVALKETEAKKKEVEAKLTEAEKAILQKAEELEAKEQENADALTKREKEILAAAEKLEAKERAYEEAEKRLQQVEALKMEVESELTAKEKVLQQQAEEIKKKDLASAEALTESEKKLLENSKAIEQRDAAAQEAQRKQDKVQSELDDLKRQQEQKQKELDNLYQTKARLENELDRSRKDLEKLREKEAQAKYACDSSCTLM